MLAQQVLVASAKHAAKASAEADGLWITLKDNAPWAADSAKSFDDMLAVKEKNAADEIKKLAATMANMEEALEEAAKNKTALFWREQNDTLHQRAHSMCHAIRNIPALKKKHWSTWQFFGDGYHKDVKDGADNEEALMTKKIVTVTKAPLEF